MSVDISFLQPAGSSVSDNERAGTMSGDEAAYWKKPADDPSEPGFVTVLQIGKNTMDRFYMNWQPLVQKYGAFNLAQGKGSKEQPGWRVESDPFLRIVHKVGGLSEFPAAQIIKLGWHRRPMRASYQTHKFIWQQVDQRIEAGMDEDAAIRAVFPQLEGLPLETWTCEFCPDRRFNEHVHLQKHESVQHKDQVQARETRNAIATALRDGQSGSGQLTETMALLMGEVAKSNAETQQALLAFLRQSAGINAVVAPTPTEEVGLEQLRDEIEEEHAGMPEPPRVRAPRSIN